MRAPRLPIDPQSAHPAARRMRVLAQAALLAFLAMNIAGCASTGDGDDDDLPKTEKPRLPVPAEFRSKLWELTSKKDFAAAAAYLKAADPIALAQAASQASDIRYFIVMGIGPVTPGIEPKPRPSRTWTFPATSDVYSSEDQRKYNLAAYSFALAYNQTLAKEEGGVR